MKSIVFRNSIHKKLTLMSMTVIAAAAFSACGPMTTGTVSVGTSVGTTVAAPAPYYHPYYNPYYNYTPAVTYLPASGYYPGNYPWYRYHRYHRNPYVNPGILPVQSPVRPGVIGGPNIPSSMRPGTVLPPNRLPQGSNPGPSRPGSVLPPNRLPQGSNPGPAIRN